METLREGTEIEVCAHTDKVSPKLFEEPVPLQTLTELHSRTIHMLTKEDYNFLAVVAESGEWLLRAPFNEILKAKKDLHIYLIAAFAVNINTLRSEFGGANVHVMKPHWWRHNRHMTIVCKDNDPRAAIYFTRRRGSFVVAPVYLDNSTDLENLLKSFYTYWQRARYMAQAMTGALIPGGFHELYDVHIVDRRTRLRRADGSEGWIKRGGPGRRRTDQLTVVETKHRKDEYGAASLASSGS